MCDNSEALHIFEQKYLYERKKERKKEYSFIFHSEKSVGHWYVGTYCIFKIKQEQEKAKKLR
jgi:hypothetical protein